MNCRERGKRLYCPGLKRGVTSSLYSKSHKHRRMDTNKHPSQEPEILPGSSNQGQTRRSNPPHQQASRKTRMEADRTGRTRSTHRGHRAAEGRPFRSRRKPTVRPCIYYLRSRFREPEGLP
ncbi:hypothetical protein TNCV_1783401 [Trichonephila clavipes]|nr:hypothetical protein TNCV_1783401 [Trichonephila clavipes]